MTRRFSRSLLVGLLAIAVVGAPLASAASAGSITAEPSTPGGTATHTATATVGSASAGSWTGFAVDYHDSGADVSNVGREDVVKVGIDRGDDESGATIDVDVSDDLSDVKVTNEGTLLQVSLGGSYSLNASDEVVVVYQGVTNPSNAGSYTIPLDVNYQSSGGETNATLAVGESTGETATATETATQTESGGGATETTSGGGPGFGALAAVGALVALAVLAVGRRD